MDSRMNSLAAQMDNAIVTSLLNLGVPGIMLAIFVWIARSVIPEALKIYQESTEEKKKQNDKIIEAATNATRALEWSNRVLEDTEKNKARTQKSLESLDPLLEEIKLMRADLAKVLEYVKGL